MYSKAHGTTGVTWGLFGLWVALNRIIQVHLNPITWVWLLGYLDWKPDLEHQSDQGRQLGRSSYLSLLSSSPGCHMSPWWLASLLTSAPFLLLAGFLGAAFCLQHLQLCGLPCLVHAVFIKSFPHPLPIAVWFFFFFWFLNSQPWGVRVTGAVSLHSRLQTSPVFVSVVPWSKAGWGSLFYTIWHTASPGPFPYITLGAASS